MEHIGVITAAGKEPSADKSKLVFKLHLDNPKYTYTLFDDSQKKFAEENISKAVKVDYNMSPDEKHRNVDSIELATAETIIASSGRDDAIATQVAVKVVAELWIAGKLTDTDVLVKGLRAELSKNLKVGKTVLEQKLEKAEKKALAPKQWEAPHYKDRDGDDVSHATNIQKEALKKMLGITDDDNFTNAIRGRFGDEALQIKDLSKNEAGDWITELQKENK